MLTGFSHRMNGGGEGQQGAEEVAEAEAEDAEVAG